jgi:hypothetical protein
MAENRKSWTRPWTRPDLDSHFNSAERLNIDPEQFIATTARMLQQFSTAVGTPEHLTAYCVTRNIPFLRGMSAARALLERKAA